MCIFFRLSRSGKPTTNIAYNVTDSKKHFSIISFGRKQFGVYPYNPSLDLLIVGQLLIATIDRQKYA